LYLPQNVTLEKREARRNRSAEEVNFARSQGFSEEARLVRRFTLV